MNQNSLVQMGGYPKVTSGTNPAANTEASLTVTAGEFWRLLAVTVTIVQGATQTPLPSLQITDGTNILCSFVGASAAQNASVTSQYLWSPKQTLTAGAALTLNTAPIADGLILKGGFVIQTSTSGKGANTDLSAITAWYAKV